MQNFNIIKSKELKNKSYRVAKICDQFDYTSDMVQEQFKGSIEFPDNWNIGIIVGKSGTGKTTIAKELFGKYFCNFKYSAECVVDDFDKKLDEKELTKMFSSVGFACVPSWLKSYNVLSNGEKMRVDLARALLTNKEIIVFDEYTSVVDREVAQLGALATHNAIKKTNKKFIAVTCHFDIIEWLQPDWVFSTDEMKMLPRGCLQRPVIKIKIKKEKGHWNIFRRYHYLTHELHRSATQYVGFYNNKPVCFCAVINFPHAKIKPLRKIHRLVVLPDYQGLGIGGFMLDFVAKLYTQKKEYIGITTSLNNFAQAIRRNPNWKICHLGRVQKHSNIRHFDNSSSFNRNTFGFKYIGK